MTTHDHENAYDVIVLGCGSAGSRAAATAAQAGARTVAIDNSESLGGLCILRGCMPTKTLLETAHRAHEIREAHRFGLQVDAPTIDFPAQMDRMRRLVDRFRTAKEKGIRGGGYELLRGPARFLDAHHVEFEGRTLSSKSFVIATGSKVRDLPIDIPADVRIHTSDDMFLLESSPKRAVVFGGGAVGLEFALWLSRMGTDVTLSVRSHLLHRSDAEIGEELTRALASEMKVLVPSKLQAIDKGEGDSLVVTLENSDGETVRVETDMVLNAMGRVPSYEGLNLEKTGLDLSQPMSIPDNLASPLPHIFFAGDAAGRRLILHEANFEGALAGHNAASHAGILSDGLKDYDHSVPPISVIFTDPAYATVGLTAQDCERQGIPYHQATKRFPEQGRGIVMGQEFGMVRLITAKGSRKVLGCQILNSRADDLIHIPATVITMQGTIDQMFRVPWYHPTLAEAFIEVCRELVAK